MKPDGTEASVTTEGGPPTHSPADVAWSQTVDDGPRRRAGLVAYLTAEVVSTTGTRMSTVAIPWFVLITTGSAALTGLVAAAELLPYVLVMGLGGPMVDRLGARRVAIASNVLAALLVALVPLLNGMGHLPLGALLVIVAVVGALRGAGTSTYVLLPGLARQAGTPIERATGLHDGMNRVASMVGLPLAGVLLTFMAPPSVLLIDAASFLVAAVLMAVWVPVSAQPPTVGERDDDLSGMKAYTADLREGFGFIRRDRLLLGIAAMILVTNLLDQAYGEVLLPVWVRDQLGSPLGLGLLGGAFGVGAVIGSALFAWVGPKLPRRAAFAWGFLVAGAPRFFLFAVASTLPPALLVSLVAGLGVGAINPALSSTEYERVPPHLQARVLGAIGALAWAGMPVGALLGGLLAQTIGLVPTLWLMGTAYLLATLSPFVFPAWKEMERRPEPG